MPVHILLALRLVVPRLLGYLLAAGTKSWGTSIMHGRMLTEGDTSLLHVLVPLLVAGWLCEVLGVPPPSLPLRSLDVSCSILPGLALTMRISGISLTSSRVPRQKNIVHSGLQGMHP